MYVVDYRHGGTADPNRRITIGGVRCSQQGTPTRVDNPADYPIRVSLAQGGNRRQGMQNVAHGAQPDHEQAKLGLRVQTLIFAQGARAGTGLSPDGSQLRVSGLRFPK